MKEVVIVASGRQSDVGNIKTRLGRHTCATATCESAEDIIELLDLFPLCGIRILYVVIESGILKDISKELFDSLRKHSHKVPFLLLAEENSQVDSGDNLERIYADCMELVPNGNSPVRTSEKTLIAMESV